MQEELGWRRGDKTPEVRQTWWDGAGRMREETQQQRSLSLVTLGGWFKLEPALLAMTRQRQRWNWAPCWRQSTKVSSSATPEQPTVLSRGSREHPRQSKTVQIVVATAAHNILHDCQHKVAAPTSTVVVEVVRRQMSSSAFHYIEIHWLELWIHLFFTPVMVPVFSFSLALVFSNPVQRELIITGADHSQVLRNVLFSNRVVRSRALQSALPPPPPPLPPSYQADLCEAAAE